MNKYICEVCGAAYPETANRCPMCGCVRNGTQQPASGANVREPRDYQHTPGGRFSKTNVRRRKQGKSAIGFSGIRPEYIKYIAVAVALLLLLALLMGLLISSCGNDEGGMGGTTSATTTETTAETTTETTEEVPAVIPCEFMVLSTQKVTLTELNKPFRISAICTPANTTDPVYFSSSDPSVIAVEEDGNITALKNGTVTITATCGTQTATCVVLCDAPEQPPVSTGVYHVSKWDTDVTLYIGVSGADRFTIDLLDDEGTKVTLPLEWVASKDGIVSITGNKVVGIAKGIVTVSTEFEGKTYTSIVRVFNKK